MLTSLELNNLGEYSEGSVAALGYLTRLTSLKFEKYALMQHPYDLLPNWIFLPPESLRYLTTLKALQHISSVTRIVGRDDEKFLDVALPILQCLPSLVSLEVKGPPVTELNASLFPVQLQRLEVGYGLPIHPKETTKVFVAMAERCPGLMSITYSPFLCRGYNVGLISFECLAAVHKRFPTLQFDVDPAIPLPFDHYNDEVWMMMLALRLADAGAAVTSADGVQCPVEHSQSPLEPVEEQRAMGANCSECHRPVQRNLCRELPVRGLEKNAPRH